MNKTLIYLIKMGNDMFSLEIRFILTSIFIHTTLVYIILFLVFDIEQLNKTTYCGYNKFSQLTINFERFI